jgi:hypothetical protein
LAWYRRKPISSIKRAVALRTSPESAATNRRRTGGGPQASLYPILLSNTSPGCKKDQNRRRRGLATWDHYPDQQLTIAGPVHSCAGRRGGCRWPPRVRAGPGSLAAAGAGRLGKVAASLPDSPNPV